MFRQGLGGVKSGFRGGGGFGPPIFMPSIKAGAANMVDMATGVGAVSSIPGTRYGIVNGVVTQFAADQPAIEDNGLRGCPAFTSKWFPESIGSDVSHSIEDGWNKVTLIANSGGATFVRHLAVPDPVVGEVSILQAVIKKGPSRYIGFRARRTGGVATVAAVFDFNIGDFSVLNTHERLFVRNIAPDIYHICLRYVAPDTAGIYFGMALCSSTGVENSTGLTIGDSVYFKSLTCTIGDNITALGTPNPASVVSYVGETATSTLGTSFDLDNAKLTALKTALRGPNAQGHLEMLFKSNFNSEQILAGTTLNLLSVNNSLDIFLAIRRASDGSMGVRIYDSTNFVTLLLPSGIAVGQTLKIIADWGYHPSGGLKMRLIVNGVQSTIANFSGSFGTQDLRFFFGNTLHAGWIVKDSFFISGVPQW